MSICWRWQQVMHDKAYVDQATFFEATPTDWREATLMSAYEGLLDNEAREYELERLRAVERLKRRKIEASAVRYSYDKSAQSAARIAFLLMAYGQLVFGIPSVVRFLFKWLQGEKKVPPTRWSNGVWTCSLFMTPVILGILAEFYYLFMMVLKRMWNRNPLLVWLMFLGSIVVFFTLVF